MQTSLKKRLEIIIEMPAVPRLEGVLEKAGVKGVDRAARQVRARRQRQLVARGSDHQRRAHGDGAR